MRQHREGFLGIIFALTAVFAVSIMLGLISIYSNRVIITETERRSNGSLQETAVKKRDIRTALEIYDQLHFVIHSINLVFMDDFDPNNDTQSAYYESWMSEASLADFADGITTQRARIFEVAGEVAAAAGYAPDEITPAIINALPMLYRCYGAYYYDQYYHIVESRFDADQFACTVLGNTDEQVGSVVVPISYLQSNVYDIPAMLEDRGYIEQDAQAVNLSELFINLPRFDLLGEYVFDIVVSVICDQHEGKTVEAAAAYAEFQDFERNEVRFINATNGVMFNAMLRYYDDEDAQTTAELNAYAARMRNVLIFINIISLAINFVVLVALGLQLMRASHKLVSAQEDLRASNSYLQYASKHDLLTNLANKETLKACFERLIYQNPNIRLAIIFIDLDNFKSVNDVLGHSVGDILLNKVSNIIRKLCPFAETICRAGGDEFVILMQFAHMNDVSKIARSIISAINKPIDVSGTVLHSTASVGAALYPFDSYDFQELYKNADTAMYEAKQSGKNHFNFYSAAMHRTRLSGYEILEKLHEPEKYLFIEYQPIVASDGIMIFGFEALARMKIDDRLIPPSEFIPLAESHGLISRVGSYILRRACEFLVKLNNEGGNDFSIAVNISALQLQDPEFLEDVDCIFRDTGINPKSVMFELTESVLVNSVQKSELTALKARGVRIGVDDFGAGYSSLSYFSQLPVSFVKIDRSFVAGIGNRIADEKLVSIILHIGQSLDLCVIAEGVECFGQFEYLKHQNCITMQGFMFGKPLAEEYVLERNGAIIDEINQRIASAEHHQPRLRALSFDAPASPGCDAVIKHAAFIQKLQQAQTTDNADEQQGGDAASSKPTAAKTAKRKKTSQKDGANKE